MNVIRSLLGRLSTRATSRISAASQTSIPKAGKSEEGWDAREEPLDEYRPSGYHPVAIGDVLDNRYQVVGKLGWGVYSTVWLVRQSSNGPYAALKVMAGDATEAPELHELEYLQHMRDQSPHHPGYSHVLQLQDHFYHQGQRSKHLCLVTEPLSEDLYSFSKRWEAACLPINLVKRITRQVILGLQFLHEECNIIHTDIKPSNIMMVVGQEHVVASASAIAEVSVGTGPDDRQVTRVRSRPISYPLPSGDLNRAATWAGADVKLADVGVSCWADKVSEHFTDLIQSPAVRAPEVCIGAGWGKPADIWSLGCTVYELRTGRPLMRRDIQPESVPYIHSLLFGDYPLEMIQRGKYSDVFFNKDGSLKIPLPGKAPWDVAIRESRAPDAESLIGFLRLTFALDPAKRATCEQLLEHEWLNSEFVPADRATQ